MSTHPETLHETKHELRQHRCRARHSHDDPAYRSYKNIALGVMLLVAGCVSFLNYLGVLHLRNVWQYAPLLMVGFGVANMVFFYSQPRLFARGAMMSFIGLWLFSVFQGFAGLTFQNSWPLVLIAFGVRIILESTLTLFASKKNLEKTCEEEHHEK